jgi:hypothetical protein
VQLTLLAAFRGERNMFVFQEGAELSVFGMLRADFVPKQKYVIVTG